MNNQVKLSLQELKEMHGKPVWCHIPSDNPKWGIVDVPNNCVVLGVHSLLTFDFYGEWKAFNTPNSPVPTIKPGDKVRHVGNGTHGIAVETSDIGAYVHWLTGQRSWYPFSYLEVVE